MLILTSHQTIWFDLWVIVINQKLFILSSEAYQLDIENSPNSRKAKFISLVTHGILLLLMMRGCLSYQEPDPPRFQEVITIDFRDDFEEELKEFDEIAEAAAAKSSTAESAPEPVEEEEIIEETMEQDVVEEVEEEEVQEEEVQPEEEAFEEEVAPEPDVVDAAPETSADAEREIIEAQEKEIALKKSREEKKRREAEAKREAEEKAEKERIAAKKKADAAKKKADEEAKRKLAEKKKADARKKAEAEKKRRAAAEARRKAAEAAAKKKASGSGTGGAGKDGKSSTPGDGTSGSSTSGNSKTDGKGDDGPGGDGFFNRIGKLERAVDKRVYPKDLTKEGKVVFNICINRDGKVMYSKINRGRTTISDRSALSDASYAMRQTTFKRDSSAPEKECGIWTLTIKNPN